MSLSFSLGEIILWTILIQPLQLLLSASDNFIVVCLGQELCPKVKSLCQNEHLIICIDWAFIVRGFQHRSLCVNRTNWVYAQGQNTIDLVHSLCENTINLVHSLCESRINLVHSLCENRINLVRSLCENRINLVHSLCKNR